MTTVFAFAILAAVLISLPGLAFAQMPGERKSPYSYDGTGDMKYRSQFGEPDDRVREAQRKLQDQGYYRGPLDGLMTPATRRAVWSFQKAKGLAPTARFDPETMAALAPAEPTGTAGTPEPQPSALPRSNGFGGNGFGAGPGFARPSSDFQAP